MSATEPLQSPHSSSARQRNILMLLSLFLQLLVFFIVLSAVSSRNQTAARGTRGSGGATWESPVAGFGKPMGGAGQERSGADGEEGRERFVGQVIGVVETWSDRIMIERRHEGERLELVFPLSGLFLPGEARYRGKRERFIAELGDVLGRAPEGWRSEIDIAVDGQPRSPVTVDIAGEIAIERSIALARTLRRTGAAPEAVSVGVTGSDNGSVRMRFTARAILPSARAGEAGKS